MYEAHSIRADFGEGHGSRAHHQRSFVGQEFVENGDQLFFLLRV